MKKYKQYMDRIGLPEEAHRRIMESLTEASPASETSGAERHHEALGGQIPWYRKKSYRSAATVMAAMLVLALLISSLTLLGREGASTPQASDGLPVAEGFSSGSGSITSENRGAVEAEKEAACYTKNIAQGVIQNKDPEAEVPELPREADAETSHCTTRTAEEYAAHASPANSPYIPCSNYSFSTADSLIPGAGGLITDDAESTYRMSVILIIKEAGQEVLRVMLSPEEANLVLKWEEAQILVQEGWEGSLPSEEEGVWFYSRGILLAVDEKQVSDSVLSQYHDLLKAYGH